VTAPVGAAAPPRIETDDGGPVESPHRWRWALLILAGTLFVVGAVLVRPGGSVQADQTEHQSLLDTKGLPGFTAGQGVEQSFVADADGLSQVTVRFGTYHVKGTGTVVVQLLSPEGTPVAVSVIPVPRIKDGELMSVATMAPQADSKGRTYLLQVSLSAEASDPITLFAGTPTQTEPAARRTDGQPATLAVEVHSDYGRGAFAFDQLGTALRRIGAYGPFWRRGAFVVLLALGAIALLAGIALVPRRKGLLVLLAFVVVKGVLWSVLIPPLLGVDEGAHVAYAQFLAIDHAIPKRGSPRGELSIYSEELTAASRIFHQGDVARSDRADYGSDATDDHQTLKDTARQEHSNGDTPASGYTPAYYAVPALIYLVTPGGLDVKLGAMRLWSVLLGAVAVYFAVRTARLLFLGRESVALLLGAAVALHPMLSQQTAVINNDAGTIAAGAACGFLAVLLTARQRSRWIPAAAGLAFGLGLLTKPLGLAFAPAIFLAWIVGRRRGCRPAPWWWEAITAAGGVLATYGVWFVFSAAYGYAGVGLQDQTAGERTIGDFFHVLKDHSFKAVRANWIDQFWGNFGWINTPFPDVIHGIMVGAVLVGSAIVIVWALVFVRDLYVGWRGRGPLMDPLAADLAWGTAVCLLIVAATLGELYVLMYEWYVRVGDLSFIQGRYALMTVPVVLVLPVVALRRLIPKLNPLIPMGVVATAMGVLNVIAMGLIVERFYL
jgi:hypothetical protein